MTNLEIGRISSQILANKWRVMAVGCLILVQFIWMIIVFRQSNSRLLDFRVYDVFANVAARGLDPYAVSKSAVDDIAGSRWGLRWQNLSIHPSPVDPELLSVPHSPFFYLMIRPMALLSPLEGARVWYLLSAVAFTAATLFLSYFRAGRFADPLMFGIVAIFAPVLQTLSGGQVNGFVLLALSGAIWALLDGKKALFGFGMALAILIKPYPALFAIILYMLWRKEFVAVGWTAVCLTLTVIMTLPFSDLTSWFEYVRGIIWFGQRVSFSTYSEGVNIWTMLGRLMPLGVASAIGLLTTLGVVVACLYVVMTRRASLVLAISLAITAVSFVATLSFLNYQVLVLVPIALLLRQCDLRFKRPVFTLSQVLVFLSIFLFDLHAITWQRLESQPMLSSWGTFALAILLALLLYQTFSTSDERFFSQVPSHGAISSS